MEVWKDIEGYEGLYEISNCGRVRSLDRYVKHNYGGLKIVRGSIKKLYVGKRRYKNITATLYKENKGKRHIVSRLVATAFIHNPDNLPIVEHIDDNPTNNNAYNLKWGTPKTNAEAREKVITHKINKAQKDFIKNSNLSGQELARLFDLTKGYIYNIKNGIR